MEKKINFTSGAWKFYNEQSEAVKKTQQTPKHEIDKAKQIRKAVLK